ncbi:MAG: alpha-L-fucosidase [Bacteroidales bacterium]|nr:alpha-L-fucosidase [Bacteroidales bacterium]
MKTRVLFIALLALCAGVSTSAQENSFVHKMSDGYEWPTDSAVLEKLDAWQDLKFGVLLTWGIYSVPGIVESWALCSEDHSWNRRPDGSNYDEFKKWYWGLSKEFNPVDFNPDQWAQVFKDAGMKYMVFTTKHHDGFCLYDSEYTDFSIAKAGSFAGNPKADAARWVFDAFRAQGFMTGAYFSKPDWHCEWFWNPYFATPNRRINYNKDKHPDWWDNYVAFTKNQLAEITGGRFGKLDILWLDGGWVAGDLVGLNEVLPEARRVSPGLICVDRTIKGPNENYQTPEQKIPAGQIDHPWESCITLTADWGWHPGSPYKSVRKVLSILAEIAAKGGSLLLGVGPTPTGIIEEQTVAVLEEIGEWMKRCGEAVYNTRITPVYNDGDLWFTASKDGKTIYAIYALPDGETLPATLEWKGNLPLKGCVTLLNNGKKLKAVVKDGEVILKLPKGLKQEPLALKFRI